MMKRIILAIKILIVVVILPLIGNFGVNKLLGLEINWVYGIFLVVGILLAIEIIGRTFSYANVWKHVQNTPRKFIVTVSLTVFLVIAFFPSAQGIQNRWVRLLCVLLALISIIPFFMLEKSYTVKKVDNED